MKTFGFLICFLTSSVWALPNQFPNDLVGLRRNTIIDCTDTCTFTGVTTVSDLTGGAATSSFDISSVTNAATASATVAAITFAPTVALDANDLIIEVNSSVAASLFTVDLEGDGTLRALSLSTDVNPLVVPTNGEFCLNGAGCTVNLSYNGSATLNTGAAFQTGTFISSAADGINGFQLNTNGARADFGAGGSDYASSDGTTVSFAGAVAVSGTLRIDGASELRLNGAAGFIGNAGAGTAVLINDVDGTIIGDGTGATGDGPLFTGDINSDLTVSSFDITSDTNDATTSTTVAAITLAPTVAISANDLVLEINNSAGTNLAQIDVEGDLTARVITSTSAAGAVAFSATTGADLDLGGGALDFLESDGTGLQTGGYLIVLGTLEARTRINNSDAAEGIVLDDVDGTFISDGTGVNGDGLLFTGDINSDLTTSSFDITTDTTAATATAAVAAITLAPTVALDANDLVLEVNNSAATSLFSVDQEGDVFLLSDINSDITASSFDVTSDTSAVTASTTVAAIALAPTVALDASDLVVEINSSAGTSLFSVDQEGDTFVTGGLRVGTLSASVAVATILSATATLDFPLSGTTDCDTLTVTVTGAATTNTPACAVGTPAAPGAESEFSCFVNAADTATVKHCSHGLATDPASATYRVTIFQY